MWIVVSVLDSVYLYEEMHGYIYCSTEYYIKGSSWIKDLNIKGITWENLMKNMILGVQKDFFKKT